MKFLPDIELTPEDIAEMKRLWSLVPPVLCKGLCQNECMNVPLMPLEAIYFIKTHNAQVEPTIMHENVIVPILGKNTPCQFLDSQGRCSIHDDRPSVCRQYGHASMQCKHGCEPVEAWTEADMIRVMKSHLEMMSYGRIKFLSQDAAEFLNALQK